MYKRQTEEGEEIFNTLRDNFTDNFKEIMYHPLLQPYLVYQVAAKGGCWALVLAMIMYSVWQADSLGRIPLPQNFLEGDYAYQENNFPLTPDYVVYCLLCFAKYVRKRRKLRSMDYVEQE